MKEYDVDVEFTILFKILNVLRVGGLNETNKKCIAYISDKITNLMDPEPKLDPLSSIRKNCDDFFNRLNIPKDDIDDTEDIIPANMEEEIYFAPDDFEYEFYNASTDDIIESPKRSNVMP